MMRTIAIGDREVEQRALEQLVGDLETQMDAAAVQMAKELIDVRARALKPFMRFAETMIDLQLLRHHTALCEQYSVVFNVKIGSITTRTVRYQANPSIERTIFGDECLAWLKKARIRRHVYVKEFIGKAPTIESMIVAKGTSDEGARRFTERVQGVAFICFEQKEKADLFKINWSDRLEERLTA